MGSSLFNALSIRADIEGLSETIVARIGMRQEALKEHVEAGLIKAVDQIDVAAIVEREARPALEKAIQDAVKAAAARLMYDPTFKDAIYRRVQHILAKEAIGE